MKSRPCECVIFCHPDRFLFSVFFDSRFWSVKLCMPVLQAKFRYMHFFVFQREGKVHLRPFMVLQNIVPPVGHVAVTFLKSVLNPDTRFSVNTETYETVRRRFGPHRHSRSIPNFSSIHLIHFIDFPPPLFDFVLLHIFLKYYIQSRLWSLIVQIPCCESIE